MNMNRIILIVFALVATMSCGTSIVSPEPEPEGDVIEARTNLPEWFVLHAMAQISYCRTSSSSPDTLLYLSQSFKTPGGLNRGSVNIIAVMRGHRAVPIEYEYLMDSSSSRLPRPSQVRERDHDVGLAWLRLDTTRANTLQVHHFDPDEMYIEGTFDARFVYDSGRRASDPLRVIPDTVYFEDGYFRMHLQSHPCIGP